MFKVHFILFFSLSVRNLDILWTHLQTAFIPLPQNHWQLFISVSTLPFNNLLKLVAVSESSDVNKNDTTFSPTTLLLILKVKFDQVASTQLPTNNEGPIYTWLVVEPKNTKKMSKCIFIKKAAWGFSKIWLNKRLIQYYQSWKLTSETTTYQHNRLRLDCTIVAYWRVFIV
jgi:hypothetical protein